MPFTASRYPADWPAISKRVRERAGQRCEQCRAPNGAAITRGEGARVGTYMLEDGTVCDAGDGRVLGRARGSEYVGRPVRVVLTVAHLDHDERNSADANLRALCQLHHLAHDRTDNARRRRARAHARLAAAELPGLNVSTTKG